ncbi:bystin isoform X2 [Triticum urartu]|uniref:bystin isoform X2 n=1 Tax=Triticum urartu TaxID=4572 RepID=UPI002043458D|nr:bystin isoform X2 [Triticum urartu]
MPALATPSYEPVSWERLPKARAPGAATATPAATAAAPSTSSLSFPVPAVDGEDDNEDVDEFNGFDTLSEYDAGVTEIDEEDEKALTAFMSKETSSKRSLGDIILQKIKEKDATVSTSLMHNY